MSEPRCNGINGSSDIDLPWFESRTRSILAVLMLKSPDYEAHFQLLHCVRSTQFYRINLQFDWIDFSFCNFTKSTFSSCNLLDQPININQVLTLKLQGCSLRRLFLLSVSALIIQGSNFYLKFFDPKISIITRSRDLLHMWRLQLEYRT